MSRRSESTITIPAPAPWLTTNQRLHWAAKATRTKAWRAAAYWRARAADLTPIAGPVDVTASIHKPTRRPYDLDGHAPTVKACLDGIRDAGVITDDDTRHVPSLTLIAGEVGPSRVHITITPRSTP